ncbi:MAG TPA: DUF4097 family beta strand repeat-containing protein [Fimbriimonadaceae bacterium]|nr:DUF4097 family beta strand repeat-containing protein [Fimbriimonadaceae bacterium]
MKEEIRRIMKLVKDGKLSPDDAADLIEAFEDSEQSERVGGGDEEAGRAEARPRSDSRADAPFAGDESADGGSVGAAKRAGGAKGSHAADEAEEEEEDGADGVEEEVTETTGTKTGRRDPFKSLVDSIEKIGKDVAGNIDWTDVANKVKVSVEKGTEAVRKAADDAKHGRGKFRFGIIFGSQESKTVELPLTVPEGKILRIEGEAGDVRITGGAESGHLTATATFRAHNEEEAKAKAEEYTPMIEESEGQVLLRHPDSSDCTVDLDVYVPDGVPVEVRLQSGDIRVIDTRSSCRVMGRSGDVVLKGLDGTVDVSLHSGDVRIEDTKSAVMSIETKSGDITMIDTQGVVNVRTSSGDVRVRRGSGRTLSIEAASGDVLVEMAEPVMGAMNIRTVSGDAKVMIPDGSDCQVMLSTLRGSVSSTLEMDDLNQESLTITGKLGQGSGSIDVSAVNGDVHLGLMDSSN